MKDKFTASPIEVHQLPADRARPSVEPAADSIVIVAAEGLQQEFDRLLKEDVRLAVWVREMQRLELQVTIFGGWVRDRLVEQVHKRTCASRDIDLVSHGRVSVLEALPGDAVLNHFGGVGLQGSTLHVDAWNLQNTFLVRRHGLPVSFYHLPLTADYTVNAVVFKPAQFFQSSELIDRGAVNAIWNGVLEFAADEVAQPLIQAARAVILAVRLELTPSPTVRSFVRVVCCSAANLETVVNGIRTYCPASSVEGALSLLRNILSGA
jgi:hypothetical protein